MGLINRISASEPTAQSSDLIARDGETVVHQQRIGQTSPVECAVNLHGDDGLAITLDGVHELQRDINGEDFAIGPFFDRGDAANFPPHVFHDGVRRETGL